MQVGEKQIPSDIDQKISELKPQEIRFVDPMKLAMWNTELAVEMVSGAVSKKTIQRAIIEGELKAFKAGREYAFVPMDFLTWFKRFSV